MDGIFADEPAAVRRLRLATCLLSDVAWRANPDFRAERGLDIALHGNWVAVTAAERATLAAALHACFGGAPASPDVALLHRLADPMALAQAHRWGLALRLGQRLTGGTAVALSASRLERHGEVLRLTLTPEHTPLYGEAVARRLKALAGAIGCTPQFVSGWRARLSQRAHLEAAVLHRKAKLPVDQRDRVLAEHLEPPAIEHRQAAAHAARDRVEFVAAHDQFRGDIGLLGADFQQQFQQVGD